MYNGDEDNEDTENVCRPDEIPAKQLLEKLNEIIAKIDKVFKD